MSHMSRQMKMQKHLRTRRIKRRQSLIKVEERPKRMSSLKKTLGLENRKDESVDPKGGTINAAMIFSNLFRADDLSKLSVVERAAVRIQRHWRVLSRLRQSRYRNKQIKDRVNSIIIYIVFLAIYFFSTIWPLSREDNYHFVNNLKGQLAEVEFNTGMGWFHVPFFQCAIFCLLVPAADLLVF